MYNKISFTELRLLQVQDPASVIKFFMRKHVQCRSRRCVLDLLHNLLRKTFLRYLLDTFETQLLDLRYWCIHNLFNGVLLHTLKNLLLGSDLFQINLVVHGRRRLVHGRTTSFHNRRNRNVHDVLLNLNTFLNVLLDLKRRHVYKVFNCVLLHTLNTGRNRTNDLRGRGLTAKIEKLRVHDNTSRS